MKHFNNLENEYFCDLKNSCFTIASSENILVGSVKCTIIVMMWDVQTSYRVATSFFLECITRYHIEKLVSNGYFIVFHRIVVFSSQLYFLDVWT